MPDQTIDPMDADTNGLGEEPEHWPGDLLHDPDGSPYPEEVQVLYRHLAASHTTDDAYERVGDMLRNAIESVANHDANNPLIDLRARLVLADKRLRTLVDTGDTREPVRVAGKAEGVRLALSYLDEANRG